MDTAVVVGRGMAVGVGAAVFVLGVRGTRVLGLRSAFGSPRVLATRRLAAGAAGVLSALGTWMLLGWPVVGAAVGVAVARAVLQRRAAPHHEVERVEAIATWAEQIRDTLRAAGGLQSAIVASSRLAPEALAEPLGRLVARLEYERIGVALRRFAREVNHPTADFVLTALITAAEHEARDLAALLGQLSATARAEAQLRTRVWIGRTRTRTAVRTIAVMLPLMVGAVMVLDRNYLRPYDSVSGQMVLAVVLGVFVAALAIMGRLGRLRLPERFLLRVEDNR